MHVNRYLCKTKNRFFLCRNRFFIREPLIRFITNADQMYLLPWSINISAVFLAYADCRWVMSQPFFGLIPSRNVWGTLTDTFVFSFRIINLNPTNIHLSSRFHLLWHISHGMKHAIWHEISVNVVGGAFTTFRFYYRLFFLCIFLPSTNPMEAKNSKIFIRKKDTLNSTIRHSGLLKLPSSMTCCFWYIAMNPNTTSEWFGGMRARGEKKINILVTLYICFSNSQTQTYTVYTCTCCHAIGVVCVWLCVTRCR